MSHCHTPKLGREISIPSNPHLPVLLGTPTLDPQVPPCRAPY